MLIVNTIHGPRFGGTHCFAVDSPATAPRSEIVAMLGALLWAVELAGKHPSSSPHFCFGFDCNLAGLAAAGVWTPSHHQELQSVARSLCHWLQSRFGESALEWKHIKSHTGHPWNEAADALSWAAVAQWVPSQDLLSRLPDLLLLSLHPLAHQWLWFLEHSLQSRPGAPAVDVRGFHFPLTTPFGTVPCSQNHPLISRQNGAVSQGPRHEVSFTLRCGTANVLTLQSKGLGARAEHLAIQFQQEKVHCIGLQETRSYSSGHQFFGSFHVLSAPAARGVGGIQFWIQNALPTTMGTLHIRPSDLRILSATSQRLIVCLKHEAIRLLFIVAHAPSDGDPLQFERFWKTTSEAIPNAYRHWKQIYLVDANARLGSIESEYVSSFGGEDENTAGSLFHQWLTTHSLFAPQTFAQHHSGQHATWTHANGGHKARLDYVLVDASLYSAAIRTWVSSQIDLSLERADHDCVCADIPLTLWPPSPSRRNVSQPKHVPSPELPPVVPWSLDVHTHAAQVQTWLSSLTPTASTAVPRKQHLSPDTWSFVQKRSTTSSATLSVDENLTNMSYLQSFKLGVVQMTLQLVILLPLNGSGYVTTPWPSTVLWHLGTPERLRTEFGLMTSSFTTTWRSIMVRLQLMKDFPPFGRLSSTCFPKLERNSAPIYVALVRRCLSFVTTTTTWKPAPLVTTRLCSPDVSRGRKELWMMPHYK